MGELRFGHQFANADPFTDDLALVLTSGRWGYIDKTGQVVFTTDVDLARSFDRGLAWVQIGGLTGDDLRNAHYGDIDTASRVVWRPSK